MKVLRTAVIGLGRIGWFYHLQEILKNEGFCLVSAADTSDERLNEASQKYNINVYTDYRKMIDCEKPDLVVIASPTVFHMEQAVYAMEKGINVILDKPMACNLEEADRIIDVMKRHGRKLMVYQPLRTLSETIAIKNIIDSNMIGSVYMIKKAYARYFRRNDWQSMRKFGGGILNNFGAHYIDQLLYLTGSSAKNISSCLKRLITLGDAEDVAKLVIETNNGVIFDIELSLAYAANPLDYLVVLGKYGSAAIEWINEASPNLIVRYLKEDELPELPLNTEMAAPGRSYANNDQLTWYEDKIKLDDFITIDFYKKCYDYFALDEQPFVPVEETREVMRIIEECRESNFCKV